MARVKVLRYLRNAISPTNQFLIPIYLLIWAIRKRMENEGKKE